MTEEQLRRTLRDRGLDPDEIEAAVDNWASDWYDQQKDCDLEDNQRKEKS